jgi:hypothetical protein
MMPCCGDACRMESHRGEHPVYERKIRCMSCGKWVRANPRLKDQRYCGNEQCQRARRKRLHQKKLSEDPEYRQNYLDSLAKWRQCNPAYWAEYRKQHPQCVDRNRQEQKRRDRWRRKCRRVLAKMYSLGVKPLETIDESGGVGVCPVLAKMYSLSEDTQLFQAVP